MPGGGGGGRPWRQVLRCQQPVKAAGPHVTGLTVQLPGAHHACSGWHLQAAACPGPAQSRGAAWQWLATWALPGIRQVLTAAVLVQMVETCSLAALINLACTWLLLCWEETGLSYVSYHLASHIALCNVISAFPSSHASSCCASDGRWMPATCACSHAHLQTLLHAHCRRQACLARSAPDKQAGANDSDDVLQPSSLPARQRRTAYSSVRPRAATW